MVLVCCVAVLIGQAKGHGGEGPQSVTLRVKALWLADALKTLKVTADEEMTANQLVVVAADGNLTPVLRDEASRALFLDERLRDRDLEVQARKLPGLPYLQVVLFRIRHEGRWRIPEYYCDICTISVRYDQACPCCQGSMDYRMKPEAD